MVTGRNGRSGGPVLFIYLFICLFIYFPHLGEGAGGALARTDLQTPFDGHIQAADQTGRHQCGGGVPLLGDALRQALGVTGKLGRSGGEQARLACR